MKGPAPGQASQLGNFNSLSGDMGGELSSHLQGGSKTNSGSTGGGQTTSSTQQLQAMQQQMGGAKSDQKPREVGSLGEELVKRPLKDIAKGIKSIFSINSLLGVEEKKDSPEIQAKKKQLHQRFNQLTQEEQAVVKQRYQQEMERKQKMAEEAEIKKQQEAQEKAQKVQMPTSPQKGSVGPSGKSGKQRAMQQLQDERTKIGKVQSAN